MLCKGVKNNRCYKIGQDVTGTKNQINEFCSRPQSSMLQCSVLANTQKIRYFKDSVKCAVFFIMNLILRDACLGQYKILVDLI
jgi:hypothetical protein